MRFGIKSAQEIFQKCISQLLDNFPGVETDIDDILIWGKTKEEHGKWLNAVLSLYSTNSTIMFTVNQY